MSWWSRLLRRPRPRSRVLVYKTRTCPLCEEALHVLRRASARTPFDLVVEEIDDDASKMAAHGGEVPVVFVDGVKRFFGRVDPVLFARTLRNR